MRERERERERERGKRERGRVRQSGEERGIEKQREGWEAGRDGRDIFY